MATFSANITLKFEGKVDLAPSGVQPVPTTIYTVPANCYLEIYYMQVTRNGTGLGGTTISIDSSNILSTSSVGVSGDKSIVTSSPTDRETLRWRESDLSSDPDEEYVTTRIAPFNVPAGSQIKYQCNSAGVGAAGTATIKGLLFRNSPS